MIFHKGSTANAVFGLLLYLASITSLALICVPDVPASLLPEGTVLEHPAVKDALQQVQHNLTTYFAAGNPDGL
jgi:hypothetical protein